VRKGGYERKWHRKEIKKKFREEIKEFTYRTTGKHSMEKSRGSS